MTCLANIFLKEAIIMAADSLKQIVSDYTTCNILGLVPCQKLFYLSKTKTGISCIGHAADSNKSIRMILNEFSKTIKEEASQEDITIGLGKFILNNYPGLQTDFYIGGYDNGIQVAFELERSPENRNHYQYRSVNEQGIAAMFSQETNDYAQSSGVDLRKLNIEQAIDFIKLLFLYEIEVVQKKRKYQGTGYPIDILVIRSNEYYFSAIKDEGDATIK